MITKNDWIVMLTEEHFLSVNTMTRRQYMDILNEAVDKINFKNKQYLKDTKEKCDHKGKKFFDGEHRLLICEDCNEAIL